MGLVGELLERAARATPTAVEDRSTGWWFRHTDDGTWWAGAALAHGVSDQPARRVEAAERFYARHGAAPRFQVCRDCPPRLDTLLAERGYRWESPISLCTTSVAPLTAHPAGVDVRVHGAPTSDWLAVLGVLVGWWRFRVEATGSRDVEVTHEARLLHGQRPQACVTVLAGGQPVGVGRAVADDGWTGVCQMATAGQARRRGVARLVLAAIARWATEQGAPRLYLQVERGNLGARRLYDDVGFTELAAYHYRVKPVPEQP